MEQDRANTPPRFDEELRKPKIIILHGKNTIPTPVATPQQQYERIKPPQEQALLGTGDDVPNMQSFATDVQIIQQPKQPAPITPLPKQPAPITQLPNNQASIPQQPAATAVRIAPAASQASVVHNGATFHILRTGETLYSVAKRYGFTVDELVNENAIADPTVISSNARIYFPRPAVVTPATVVRQPPLRIRQAATVAQQQPQTIVATLPQPASAAVVKQPVSAANPTTNSPAILAKPWRWPVTTPIVTKSYDRSAALTERGIDIQGVRGSPVFSVADGVIVFIGDVEGFGKIVIVSHLKGVLSIYSQNDELSNISENQRVQQGQKIATMGVDSAGKVRLHFQVRVNGEPVDPMKYLPAI